FNGIGERHRRTPYLREDLFLPLLDTLRDYDLTFASKEAHSAHLTQIHADGVSAFSNTGSAYPHVGILYGGIIQAQTRRRTLLVDRLIHRIDIAVGVRISEEREHVIHVLLVLIIQSFGLAPQR